MTHATFPNSGIAQRGLKLRIIKLSPETRQLLHTKRPIAVVYNWKEKLKLAIITEWYNPGGYTVDTSIRHSSSVNTERLLATVTS